jgi:CPA1 family monovalent cation:H+ antiporter
MKYLNWLPLPTLLVLVGFFTAQVMPLLGINQGIYWDDLYPLAWYVLLPTIVYEIAFRLNAEGLFRNLGLILLLSIPLLLVNVLVAALFMYAGLGNAHEFPLVAALITAAMLAANSPAAVGRVVEGLHLPLRLLALLKGESLFSSMFALVLVSLVLQVEGQARDWSLLQGFIHFVKLFSGGILLGLLSGLLGSLLMYLGRWSVLRGLLSLLVAYGTFWLAEAVLGVSGIVAVLTAGLLLNTYGQRTDTISRQWLDQQWHWMALVASSLMFLILGLSVYLPILREQWQAILLGIGVVLLARAVLVFGGLWLYDRVGKAHHTPIPMQIPLWWGGIKGMVSILLVFALPADLEYSYTVQAVVYGVVLFSLLVQAPTLRWVVTYTVGRNTADS